MLLNIYLPDVLLWYGCVNGGTSSRASWKNHQLKYISKTHFSLYLQPFPGVVTHSSGNHAQALAWVASLSPSSRCRVVVPRGTPLAKKRAIEGYGANLVECEPNPVARVETCKR